MRTFWQIPLALTVLAVAPRMASAEPVPVGVVSYSQAITIEYAADYGDAFHMNLRNGGVSDGFSYGFNRSYFQVFDPQFAALPRSGSEPEQRYDFTATVTLTDRPSGESAVFTFDGYGYATATDHPWGTFTEYGIIFPEYWQNGQVERNWVRLGDSMYSVDATHSGIVQTGSHPVGWMDVPEPGTLALAGLGLAAVGGWWVKRRRAVTGRS